MRSLLLVFTFLLFCGRPGLHAANPGESPSRPFSVLQRTVTGDELRLTLALDSPGWTAAGELDQPVQVAEYPSGGMLELPGYAAVPTVGGLFRLPPQKGVSVEVLHAEYETLTGVDYAACAGDEGAEELVRVRSREDSWYPGVLAETGEPAVMRAFRVANLVIYPVQVNTARREARVYHSIELALRFDRTDRRNTLDRPPSQLSRTFLPYYQALLDWAPGELDEYRLYRGGVQVVCNNSAKQVLEDWIEWKRQKGWELEFITEDDANINSCTSIRNELQDRWDSAENKFDHVIVVGDRTGPYAIPPGRGYGDHSYGLLAGQDELLDVTHTRISVESRSELQAYINKVLAYEKNPDLDDTGWYDRGFVHATDDVSGISTIYCSRYARNAMLEIGYSECDTAWYNDGLGNPNTRATNALNNGVSMYGHRGRLNTGLSDQAILNLGNVNKTPMVLDITCGTGDWLYDGTNEAWMRSGTIRNPTGGIAAMGMHTWGTHTRYNNAITTGAWYALLVQRSPTVGMSLWSAKFNLYVNYAAYELDNTRDFNDWCNTMGDGSVYLWTDVPHTFEIDRPEDIDIGENTFQVDVLDEDSGDPVEGAWVTLYREEIDGPLQFHSETDESGTAVLYPDFPRTGDAVLTITAQNYAPLQEEVRILRPQSRVGIAAVQVVDNGQYGTSGNSNGRPDAGERIGLRITAENYGIFNKSGVMLNLESDDAWIDSIRGEVEFGTIDAGNETVADDIILLRIAPGTPNRWIAHLDANFRDENGSRWTNDISLEISSFELAFVDLDFTHYPPPPGRAANLTITVMNTGDVGVSDSADAVLQSLDPRLIVESRTGEFTELRPGRESESSLFRVSAHETAFHGHQAPARLIVTSREGLVDTLTFTIPVGRRSSDDPTGPDGYGYYAFDDTDDDYEDYAPSYDWVEINPNVPGNDFNGTNLRLHDSGANDDDATVVDLPFEVQYYGEVFDEMTITLNGMVAMGSQGDMRNFRNYTIPSPGGPNYMIAPYWDERISGNDTRVLTYYDQAGGRFIVEWYQVYAWYYPNYRYNPCTFQLIIYDTIDGHDSWTGDNDILFQYEDMVHTTGHYTDSPYWTTGIENGTQDDGLLYSYRNSYTDGSARIRDGRAILFTTNIERITGNIEGRVVEIESRDPVQGAVITAGDGLHRAVTDEEGCYSFADLREGQWELNIETECFNPVPSEQVNVVRNQTVTHDFELAEPLLVLDTTRVEVAIPPDSSRELTFDLRNPGSGRTEYFAYLFLEDPRELAVGDFPALDPTRFHQPWQSRCDHPLDPVESRYCAIVQTGDYYYLAGAYSGRPGQPNRLYKYSRDWELIDFCDQPVPEEFRSAMGFTDLAWDGEYLYGIDSTFMFTMSIGEDSVLLEGFVELPLDSISYLVHDQAAGGFWIGNGGSDIVCVDESGDILRSLPGGFDGLKTAVYYPMAGFREPIPAMFVITSHLPDRTVRILHVRLDNGEREEVHSYRLDNITSTPVGVCISTLCSPIVRNMILLVESPDTGRVHQWSVDLYDPAPVRMFPRRGYVQPDSLIRATLTFRSAGFQPDTSYMLYLWFETDACGLEENVVELSFSISDTTNIISEQVARPYTWKFDGAYPNPFNSVVTIRFSLEERTLVSARAFNLLGREVEVLADRVLPAGYHALRFKADNLSSGIYFLRFEAGPIREVRKLVLLK